MFQKHPRRVAVKDMLHFVGQDPGQFLRALDFFQKTAKDDNGPSGRRKGIYLRVVHDDNSKFIGPLREGGRQGVDDLLKEKH